jgi:cytochrome c
MHRREWGKIGAGIAMAIVVAGAAGWVGNLAVPAVYPARSAYQVPGLTEPTVDLASLQRSWPAGMDQAGSRPRLIGYMTVIDRMKPAASITTAAAAPAPPEVDLGTRLAASDIMAGERIAKVCGSCHTFDPDGANRVGPNLWGVVGRDIAAHAGFDYSKAMTGQPGTWTYERLDHYLAGPARAVPGNKMGFAGIRNPNDRASLIAWLGTLNSKRIPFPRANGKANP